MLSKIRSYIVRIFPLASRKAFHSINKLLYKGDRYYCPVCERGYKIFFPGPDNRSNNSKCPGCGSLERQRLLWLYLTKKLKIKDNKLRLLNVAPDYAIQNKLRDLNNIDYISIDLESPLAEHKADLRDLHFPHNSFDAALCYHVLEHIENDKKAISELFRVLKPGGWAIIQSPVDIDRKDTFEDFSITSPQKRKEVFGQEDHVRIYGQDYFKRLQSAGLNVNEDSFVDSLGLCERERFVLDKDEKIVFCTKPGT